ncbi:MAG TPA: tRNA (adenosine(37)-N6)-threonylcarbamoyltransferase complex dimerization subunit type 1 TsaB [Gammaproteobacteria bacterium]|nr:tRNA (adenosine(37)-N6)-threonylcarbamoyltransferase complex dimerization subunit type 1 TsaB [Gammaproteobacteria bacterium]
MNLLGIETSSAVGSVALATPGGVHVREIATPREQTEQVLKLVDELLAAAGCPLEQLDGIAFGRGPGSFTGLRVSAAIAQGLAVASNLPVLPVSSLLCLAERAWREAGCERCLVCVDAHMGEVYWAETVRRDGVVQVVGPERLGAPADVAVPAGGAAWAAIGSGFAAPGPGQELAGLLARATRVLAQLQPSAADLFPQAARDLAAGRGVAAAAALPVYLREQTAWRRSS